MYNPQELDDLEDKSLWTRFIALYSNWGLLFVTKYEKAIAYGTLITLLFVSTLDLILDWCNYADLSSDGFQYGLVSGAPMPNAVIVLLAFNLSGTVLWLLETANALTLMCNGGHMRFPLEVEQGLAIMLEELPLATVNLAIVICRSDEFTPHQTTCGVLALFTTALRLYAYGWLKEWHFKYERSMTKVTVKVAICVSSSALWAMLFFSQCFTWHHASMGGAAGSIHVQSGTLGTNGQAGNPSTLGAGVTSLSSGVSLFLLKRPGFPFPPYKHYANASLMDSIALQGLDEEHPWLVKDIDDIIAASSNPADSQAGLDTYIYTCHRHKESIVPIQCHQNGVQSLKFHFSYVGDGTSSALLLPYGEIQYNIGKLVKADNKTSCVTAEQPLELHWQLYYAVVTENSTDMAISSPWTKSCYTPVPRYNSQLQVC